MALFKDLWEGIKTVGSGLLDITVTIAEALIEGVFWLVDRIFDAIEAIIGLVEWTFEKIGDWLSPEDKTGEVVILPPTPAINSHIKEMEQKGLVKVGTAVKVGQGKMALQTLVSDGEVKGMVFAGSEKGLSSEINSVLKTGKLYKVPVEG